MAKLHIKKGDIVYVITGEDKEKQGRVLKVLPEKNLAIVEGVNIVTKHRKPKQEGQTGIEESEAPIHLSNLKLICPETGKPTRIGRKLNDAGKLVRYSKKSDNKVEIK
ncbi:MAG: 50S ribosomal protein L24 [Bacteroidales bacterium]|nr:50S ribosomal protein L24 [Bacteroidales bacterium]